MSQSCMLGMPVFPLWKALFFPQQAHIKPVGLPGLWCGFPLGRACETTAKDPGFPVEKTQVFLVFHGSIMGTRHSFSVGFIRLCGGFSVGFIGLCRGFSVCSCSTTWGCPAARAGLSGGAPSLRCGAVSALSGSHPSPQYKASSPAGSTTPLPRQCQAAARHPKRRPCCAPAKARTVMRPASGARDTGLRPPGLLHRRAVRAGLTATRPACGDLPCTEPPRLSALLRVTAFASLTALFKRHASHDKAVSVMPLAALRAHAPRVSTSLKDRWVRRLHTRQKSHHRRSIMSTANLYTPAQPTDSAAHHAEASTTAGCKAKPNQSLPSFVIKQALEFMQKQAAAKGVSVSKTEILFTISQDPKGNAAQRFEQLCDLGFKTILN